MKPAPFDYHRPESVSEAVDLLAGLGEDAKVLAGGQSLLPIMNMRLAEPAHLIDITGIAELRRSTTGARAVTYGAATTHLMIEDGLVPDATGGLLATAASGIGYRAIRARGTLAGSLAHSDSSAEWPTLMSALNAVAHVVSAHGTRRVPVRDLLLGFLTTALEPDELIVAVEVPSPEARTGFYKMSRKSGEFAESLAVALVRPSGTELWLGAASDTPTRLTTTEDAVGARGADDVAPAELRDAIATDTGATGHPLHLHAAAVHRALHAAEREESHA